MSTNKFYGWENGHLKELVTLQRGFDITKYQQEDGQYSVISSSGFQSKHSEFKVHGPGVIIGRKGTLGTVYYSEKPYWPHDTTLWVKDFHGNNPKFSYYFLKNLHLEKYDSGAANPTLNRNHIHMLPVKIPSVPTQKSIESIISRYDDLIANNEKRIKILEELSQRLYVEWFVKFRFPGHEKVKIVDSGTTYNRIPEGWEVKKIKELGKVTTGKTPSTSELANFGGNVLFIKTPDLHGNIFILDTEQTLSDLGAKSQAIKMLPEKTVFVSCIGTLGVVGITSRPSQTNQQINAVVADEANNYIMLYFFMKGLKKQLVGLGSNGATMGNVNKDKFENIKIIYPNKKLREEFFNHTANLFDEILNLEKQIKTLSKIRDLLIPQLVTGRRELKHI